MTLRKSGTHTVILAILFNLPFIITAADIEKGKQLYATKCVKCHGPEAEGLLAEGAPRLRGQYDWYLESQIEAFLKQTRKNPKMLPFIKDLSKDDIKNVSSYLSQLK